MAISELLSFASFYNAYNNNYITNLFLMYAHVSPSLTCYSQMVYINLFDFALHLSNYFAMA